MLSMERERERMEGEKRTEGWESSGLTEIVWLHYCNHWEIKQQSSILWGLWGNCFCVQKTLRSHPFCVEKRAGSSDRCTCVWYSPTYRERAKGWELNCRLGHERQKKKGTIRKPPGWRYQIASSVNSHGNLCWDLILRCDYVTERKKDLKATHAVTLRGLIILTDATRNTTRQGKGMHSTISCTKCTQVLWSEREECQISTHCKILEKTFWRPSL